MEVKGLDRNSHELILNERSLEISYGDDNFHLEELTTWICIKMILSRSISLTVSIIFDFGTYVCVLWFIGHYTQEEYYMGGVGLGFTMYNFFLRSFVLGFNNSLSTLLSQAYGSRRYQELADITNRARILFSILLIPLL